MPEGSTVYLSGATAILTSQVYEAYGSFRACIAAVMFVRLHLCFSSIRRSEFTRFIVCIANAHPLLLGAECESVTVFVFSLFAVCKGTIWRADVCDCAYSAVVIVEFIDCSPV